MLFQLGDLTSNPNRVQRGRDSYFHKNILVWGRQNRETGVTVQVRKELNSVPPAELALVPQVPAAVAGMSPCRAQDFCTNKQPALLTRKYTSTI